MPATSTQIRAFNAVAHEGSFAKAAKRLHVSQPAVTLQVRRLEDTYGVVLFDRRGAKVTLTPIGVELVELTDQIRTLEEEIDDLLSAQYDLTSGSLTVATGSPQVTMGLVSAFQRRYPQCKVTVIIGNAGEIIEAIFNRRADIACATDPREDDRIVAIPFSSNEVVALLPSDHALAREKYVRLDSLASERLIVRVDKSYTQQIVSQLFEKQGVPLNPGLYVESREAVHEAVAAGLGVGFIFDQEVGEDARVSPVKLGRGGAKSMEKIICLKAQARRRLVKAFLNVAREWQSPDVRKG